jgi:hypothetical protein
LLKGNTAFQIIPSFLLIIISPFLRIRYDLLGWNRTHFHIDWIASRFFITFWSAFPISLSNFLFSIPF